MIPRTFLIAIILCLTSPLAFANRDDGMMPAESFFLPEGDAKAGKEAFERLRCNSCHWVRNRLDLSPPVADKPGPILTPKQADYSIGWLANSIISPSHTIALDSKGEAEGSELSRMGNFAETMTVREMIDIVAFIRSLKYQDEVVEKT